MTAALLPSFRHRVVTTDDGLTLPVVETGDPGGVPVVFVHGVASSWQVWRGVLSAPALSRYRLIAFDLRGHGQAPTPIHPDQPLTGPLPTGEQLWPRDLDAVLAEVPGAHLVGWSFGCTVIQGWLVRHGPAAGYRSITLACGPNVLAPTDEQDPAASLIDAGAAAALFQAARGGELAFAERVLTRGAGDPAIEPSLLASTAATALGTRPEAVEDALAYTFDHRRFLAALPPDSRRRLHVLLAGRDQIFNIEAMRVCWGQADVETTTIPEAPHAFPARDPERFIHSLLNVLALHHTVPQASDR